MRRIVRESIRSPDMEVRRQAIQILDRLPSKDFDAELHAVWDWVDRRIRFVRDIRGVETLQTPERTLEIGAGDCDDHAILLSALLENVGFETRFHAMGFAPGRFSHVMTEAKMGREWVPLETTVKGAYIGWYPPGIRASMTQNI